MRKDTKGTRLLDASRLITRGIGDLAVVDNHGETTSSLAQVPADAGGELGVVVGHEELAMLVLSLCARDVPRYVQSCHR